MRMISTFALRSLKWAFWLIAGIALTHCQFKKNRPDHPYPSEQRTEKAFFETIDKDGHVKLKTFIAGHSPEMAAGQWSSAILPHINGMTHVNMVFEIHEDTLVGKQIIPSFVTKEQDCLLRDSEQAQACRSRWPNVITIPISSHFYYERQKDSRGRETDIYQENSSRSHWSARPYMNLNFGGIKIKDWAMDLLWNNHEIDSVSDVDWDTKTGFVAFTAEASDSRFGSRLQGKFRFNFKEFHHDPTFTPTPYNYRNAKYINVLHVIGKQIDGDPANEVLYGAHWDTRKKHTIWLHGFPKEYEHIGMDIIKHWNDAFEKVGHGRPFEGQVSDRKYAFDLRYTTIDWVNDKRLSYSAPLGVGQALADVRNGEILWGRVTVWGGMLESLTNHYSQAATIDSKSTDAWGQTEIIQLGLMEPKDPRQVTESLLPSSLMRANSFESVRQDILRQLQVQRSNLGEILDIDQFNKLVGRSHESADESEINPIAIIRDSFANPQNVKSEDLHKSLQAQKNSVEALIQGKDGVSTRLLVDEIAQKIVEQTQQLQLIAQRQGSKDQVFDQNFIQKLINYPTLSESAHLLPTYRKNDWLETIQQKKDISPSEMIDQVYAHEFTGKTGRASFCTERTFGDVADSIALGASLSGTDKVKATSALIKDLLLHEVGHMMGLGHNFKENILPRRGSIPNVSRKLGLYKDFSFKELEDDAHNQFRNYTTVMGYKNGITDTILDYKDLQPGPADLTSLEYLYNRRYPVYREGLNGAGDIEYAKLTTDGFIIPEFKMKSETGINNYKVAYFPACNDYTATMGTDPYCARWDRGYDAPTLVENYFSEYRGNLISKLNAFSDTVKGGNSGYAEWALWSRTLSTFSRVRTFYDYMRQTYDSEIRGIAEQGSEDGIANLLDFGSTCTSLYEKESANPGKETRANSTKNEKLTDLFENNRELLELCAANAITMRELSQLMQIAGKDYTQIDYKNQFSSLGVTGGEAGINLSRAYGTWKELARIPIKISSLLTLTSPYPFSFWSGWLVPIRQYSRADGSYHMSTLYPREYSQAIASGTEMNLSLGASGLNESTTIGRTVMAMGHYLSRSIFSNDVLMIGTPFSDNIRDQTKFRYSMAFVDVTKETEDKNANIAKKFNGTIYNIYNKGPETIPELFIFTQDRIIARPASGSLLMPMGKIRWYSKTAGYFLAIKMDYTDDFFDNLKTNSVRRTLSEAYQEVLKACVLGTDRNGLKYFFNRDVADETFPGFEFPDNIGIREEATNRFLRSVKDQFDKYYDPIHKKNTKWTSTLPNRSQCEDAIRGQSVLVLAASVLNGYYFSDILDYIEKDSSW